jgi:TatA/E family protein of Tat protein translocase
MNFLQNLGTTEWLVIIFVLLTLFGKKKLMEWAKGLGESGREMQKVKREFEGTLNAEDTPVTKKEVKSTT